MLPIHQFGGVVVTIKHFLEIYHSFESLAKNQKFGGPAEWPERPLAA